MLSKDRFINSGRFLALQFENMMCFLDEVTDLRLSMFLKQKNPLQNNQFSHLLQEKEKLKTCSHYGAESFTEKCLSVSLKHT